MDHNTVRKMRLGGSADAAALCGLGLSALCSSPAWAGTHWGIPATLGALGGLHLGHRWVKPFFSGKGVLGEHMISGDDVPVDVKPGEYSNGLLLGYTVDKAKPVIVSDEFLTRHGFILGASGVGKTVLGEGMMLQQIMRGGGLAFIDGKLDFKNLETIHAFCKWAGRERDLLVLNPGDPSFSNTYNPILYGDPDEVASRILSLIPSTENDPGTDFYKQAANQGITTLVAALQAAELSYNFMDLTILLMNAKAIAYLESIIPEKTQAQLEAKTNLRYFLEQYKVPGKEGKMAIDIKRMKETFGGIGGRMFMFGTGSFGEMMNVYDPEINLYNAITTNKIIYIMLPTMGKSVAASNFAKMMIGDLRTSISWMQKLKDEEKPNPTYFVFMDEANSYVAQSFQTMFEQSRSARVALIPAVQTLAGFDAVDPTLTEMVLGNCWTKIYFKIGTQDSAERSAELIGTYRGMVQAIAETDSESVSANPMAMGPEYNQGTGGGVGFTQREEESYKVDASKLKALKIGEAIVTFGGDKVYHIKVPQFEMSKVVKDSMNPVKLNHYKSKYRKGINLFNRSDEFLSPSDKSGLNDSGQENFGRPAKEWTM
jgi:intracellular multiplication protein IcmO